jgi:hypothetical protein
MAIKATINSVPKNRVSVNKQTSDTIRAVNVGLITKLSQLTDVTATDLTSNNTIVYDSTADKFVVSVLPKISGGTF